MALAVHDVPGHTVTVSVANLRRQLYKDRGPLSATVAWVTTPCFTCKSFCTLDCLTGGMREIEPPGKGDCFFFVFFCGVWGGGLLFTWQRLIPVHLASFHPSSLFTHPFLQDYHPLWAMHVMAQVIPVLPPFLLLLLLLVVVVGRVLV